jgi:YHS domain-containing protein
VLYEPRGRQPLRNVREPVELFAAVRIGQDTEHRLALDPVCRMAVDPDHAAGRLMDEGTAYFFCTLACAGAFAHQPDVRARRLSCAWPRAAARTPVRYTGTAVNGGFPDSFRADRGGGRLSRWRACIRAFVTGVTMATASESRRRLRSRDGESRSSGRGDVLAGRAGSGRGLVRLCPVGHA